MVIYLTINHCFLLKLGCGFGLNSRAKLLALWGLLQFASWKNILSLQVCSDSHVIVDWAMCRSSLKVTLLQHWCDRTKKLIDSFNEISIKHIYREFNVLADHLLSYRMAC